MATKETPELQEQTPEVSEQTPEVSEPEIDGVLVLKRIDGDSITTEVQALGSVQPTEVQTLLELGVQRWRRQIGL